jgi:hypothetical protein
MHGARIFRACSGQRNRGLERHATTGTGSGLAGSDFRTHRANIRGLSSRSGARNNWSCWSRTGGQDMQRNQAGGRRTRGLGQIFFWIRFECLGAGGATKVDRFSGVFEVVLCGRRVHVHAANRIFHSGRRVGNVIVHAPRGILAAGFWRRTARTRHPGLRGHRAGSLKIAFRLWSLVLRFCQPESRGGRLLYR